MSAEQENINAFLGRWEQRWHPLRKEWVIMAGHRQNRPWSGETLANQTQALPAYDPTCYLCPGNPRVSGQHNPAYTQTYVFDNDHPCVGPHAPTHLPKPEGIYRNRPASGLARVVCYSPKHNLTLAELERREVENLLATWQQQYTDLGNRPEIDHVLIFENKGEAVGVSNPHPHCQIYATNFVFKTIETEASASQRHWTETGRCLFQDILAAEQQSGQRILCENETAIAFIPYFGRYAYEVFVAPKATHPHIAALSDQEVSDFADVLRRVLIRFDNLWRMPFPYVMPLHQAPTDGGDYHSFHFHIEFHPPLRKPNLLKYLAGPEIGGGNFLSDTVPEDKAAELRDLSEVHYKQDKMTR
jgi:UDPglucose--hexose-1-phosphate uridylyltransferase